MFFGRGLDAPERRKEDGEVVFATQDERIVRIFDELQRCFIAAVEVLDLGRLLAFARHGDVVQFGLKGFFKDGFVLKDQILAFLGVAEESEEQAAVDSLQALLHLLAGDDAAVVLAEDDVDRIAQARKVDDALNAEGHQDNEQDAEAQNQFLAEA